MKHAMKHAIWIALVLLAACSRPAPTSDETSDLGQSQEALTDPGKFGWDASDWSHEVCSLTDPSAICYFPRFTDKIAIWWDEYDSSQEPMYTARFRMFSYAADLGVIDITQHNTEPLPPAVIGRQLIKITNDPWGIGTGPLATLDQAAHVRVYCLDASGSGGAVYRGRAFGWGAQLYTCKSMGMALDSASANWWRIMSGSSRTNVEIFTSLFKHAFGAALGQPTDSSAPYDDNPMLPFIDDDVIGETEFDACQTARAEAYNGQGGYQYSPIVCGL